MKYIPSLTAVLLLPLAACSDLFMESERIPASLVIADSVVTTVEGRVVPLSVTVLDQHGRPFERLPGWAAPVWTVSEPVVEVRDEGLVAVAPGEAVATVQVAGMTATARVRVNPLRMRLTVHAIQLTQAAQPEGGTAPVVAGREAMLRVFLKGDRPSFFTPEVRVKVYHGASLVRTLTASAAGIPMFHEPAKVAESWNVAIPAELMVPGLRLLVEADPQGIVPLASGSVTVYPASGVPLAADVRVVPPLHISVVPIFQTLTGTTGAINEFNVETFLIPTKEMFPVEQVHVDLHAVYSTASTTAAGPAWGSLLLEMALLRQAEGAKRYYYGVLRPSAGGVTGIGYLGGPAALGWDVLPAAAQTMAHELGHNFNRQHAPCGNPAGVDLLFPTVGARLDAFGWDVANGAVRAPTQYYDLMSYCAPEWITHYTYQRVMDFRAVTDWDRGAQSVAPEPVVLVWGSIRGGEVVLEPAFEVMAPRSLPERAGPYLLEARDAAGATLYSIPFDATEVEDGAPGERHFVFAVPRGALGMERMESLRVRAPGGESVRVSRAPAPGQLQAAAPTFSARRTDRGRAVRLEWARDRHPMVMVRDPGTGQVIGLGRGGRLDVRTSVPEVDLLFSDGVRTTGRRVRVQ